MQVFSSTLKQSFPGLFFLTDSKNIKLFNSRCQFPCPLFRQKMLKNTKDFKHSERKFFLFALFTFSALKQFFGPKPVNQCDYWGPNASIDTKNNHIDLCFIFDVICVIWHRIPFDVIWRIWHQNMTSVNMVDIDVQRSAWTSVITNIDFILV